MVLRVSLCVRREVLCGFIPHRSDGWLKQLLLVVDMALAYTLLTESVINYLTDTLIK